MSNTSFCIVPVMIKRKYHQISQNVKDAINLLSLTVRFDELTI